MNENVDKIISLISKSPRKLKLSLDICKELSKETISFEEVKAIIDH
jgi:hypothetical protein